MRSCSRSLAGVCATVRLGFGAAAVGGAVSSFPRFPQDATVSAAHSSTGAAKRRPPKVPSRHSARCAKSATGPRSDWNRGLIPVLHVIQMKTGAQSSNQALFPAQHLNLPHPQQLDSWSSPRRDNAADTNPSIFEQLRSKAGALKRRYGAPWNSRSKVPCPVSSKIQVGNRPRLSNGQNPALDHRKLPNRCQNIARTFRVFYDRGVGPDAQFGIPCRTFGGGQCCGTIFIGYIGRNQRFTAAQQLALHRLFRAAREQKGTLPAIAVRRIVVPMQRHVAAAGEG